ncbi:MAG: type II secretion system F family protein [Candidatus Electryonea clarkiae]|nr:type II secretion system F family protein [Candidatus Electryonea clarkiae]MDP8288684.1 type II secretion system F family protein [Candidatus Electryonea clarkiae]
MPIFGYIVTETDGTRREDRIRATNYESAWEQLTKRGAKIISLREIKISEQARSASIVDQVSTAIYRLKTRVPLNNLVFFTRQLSTMFSAGLTIEKSIANLMQEEKHRGFKKTLAEVANDLKRGKSLSDSLGEHPGVFDALFVALVNAGEVSGSLHVVLLELSNYLESVADTKRKVVSALAYPTFVVIFMLGILGALLVFIVPQFTSIYNNFGAELPIQTRILVSVSDTVSGHFIEFTGLGLVVLFFGWIMTLTEKGGIAWDTFRMKFPVLGQLHHDAMMNRFAKTFGILMGAGVPILESLTHTKRVVRNHVVERAIEQCQTMIRDGFAVSVALKKVKVFPSTLIQLVATGEETGEMDQLLDRAAYFYEKQVEAVVERLTSLIQPLMIVLLGGVVIIIVVAIYLPIFNIGRALRAGLG